jgi:hypothetical protein
MEIHSAFGLGIILVKWGDFQELSSTVKPADVQILFKQKDAKRIRMSLQLQDFENRQRLPSGAAYCFRQSKVPPEVHGKT